MAHHFQKFKPLSTDFRPFLRVMTLVGAYLVIYSQVYIWHILFFSSDGLQICFATSENKTVFRRICIVLVSVFSYETSFHQLQMIEVSLYVHKAQIPTPRIMISEVTGVFLSGPPQKNLRKTDPIFLHKVGPEPMVTSGGTWGRYRVK